MSAATTAPTGTTDRRRVALVAGWSLLAMAVLGGLATFGVVERLDTTADLPSSGPVLRLAAAALLVVAVLDLVVAGALYAYFAPVAQGLAALAGGFRAAYAVVYVAAIAHLAAAARLTESQPSDALDRVADFMNLWETGLSLFGLHLVLVGWLAVRSGEVPRWIGVLVLIAGAGYTFDALRVIVAPSGPDVSTVTFLGEVVLLVWLLVRGGATRR